MQSCTALYLSLHAQATVIVRPPAQLANSDWSRALSLVLPPNTEQTNVPFTMSSHSCKARAFVLLRSVSSSRRERVFIDMAAARPSWMRNRREQRVRLDGGLPSERATAYFSLDSLTPPPRRRPTSRCPRHGPFHHLSLVVAASIVLEDVRRTRVRPQPRPGRSVLVQVGEL